MSGNALASAAAAFERCIRSGGVAVFPSDTVYGLACDPLNAVAVRRLCAFKGRSPEKASAVMWFTLESALRDLPELPPRTRAALEHLLPGGLTVLLPNPTRRFPLACGSDPEGVGVRVPKVPLLSAVGRPVLQSSANFAGGVEARRLEEVAAKIRADADLVLDGGELPGTASTVLDLRHFESDGSWSVVRPGAVPTVELEAALVSSTE